MSNIKTSTIWKELTDILDNGKSTAHASYNIELEANGETILPLKLLEDQLTRQFTEQFSDYRFITILIGEGTYNEKILPFKDSLKVTIYKKPVEETTGESNIDSKIIVRTYLGSILDNTNEKLESKHPFATSQEDLDKGSQIEVNLQLVDPAAEQLSYFTVGGILSGMRTDDAVKGILSIEAGKLELPKDSNLKGVDMVQGDNDDLRDHIIIPHGTKLTQLADYIHRNAGGVYNTGLSQYIQNGIWYVYPQYHLGRFKETDRTAIIYRIPERTVPNIERTFKFKDNKLSILATDKVSVVDPSERKQLSDGIGNRYVRAGMVIEEFVVMEAGDGAIDSRDNMVEYIVDERKNKLHNVPFSTNRITSNHVYEISKLADRMCQVMIVNWENGDPDLLYPGMPIKYVYLDGDTVNEIYGNVMGVESTTVSNSSPTVSKYINMINIFLYVERMV